MPVVYLRVAVKSKCRPLATMVQLKRNIVEAVPEENSLAHALIIALAKLNNDLNYIAYRKGRKIRPMVHQLL